MPTPCVERETYLRPRSAVPDVLLKRNVIFTCVVLPLPGGVAGSGFVPPPPPHAASSAAQSAPAVAVLRFRSAVGFIYCVPPGSARQGQVEQTVKLPERLE